MPKYILLSKLLTNEYLNIFSLNNSIQLLHIFLSKKNMLVHKFLNMFKHPIRLSLLYSQTKVYLIIQELLCKEYYLLFFKTNKYWNLFVAKNNS